MTLVDFTQPLEDSLTLCTLAKRADVTRAQAKAMLAALADMDIRDVLRISELCRRERVRQIRQTNREFIRQLNRESRK